jgi:excisionase family DNA binding protein
MNDRITRREAAKQFIIAFELLLEWIEQGDTSHKQKDIESIQKDPHELRLLTATEVAKIFKISKSLAYRLIQLGEFPSIRIGRSVRVREEDLEKFTSQSREENISSQR